MKCSFTPEEQGALRVAMHLRICRTLSLLEAMEYRSAPAEDMDAVRDALSTEMSILQKIWGDPDSPTVLRPSFREIIAAADKAAHRERRHATECPEATHGA